MRASLRIESQMLGAEIRKHEAIAMPARVETFLCDYWEGKRKRWGGRDKVCQKSEFLHGP